MTTIAAKMGLPFFSQSLAFAAKFAYDMLPNGSKLVCIFIRDIKIEQEMAGISV
ncbi:MAG TPA: hypothetical protein VFB60_11740 [Ktedonobacteraceae bacterium]|nr:hypothetical protein [Ktedonobacteraceae bacterium]